MTLTQIKYFIHSAKTCNFHQSAEELFVSQQGLSKQIQALEKELGLWNPERILYVPAC